MRRGYNIVSNQTLSIT